MSATDSTNRGNTIHGCGSTRNGKRVSKAYETWHQIKQRCLNPNNAAYSYYGGRGIKVCERWMRFVNFLADMGEPATSQSIDRIDNDGDYEPNNCRWADAKQQANNTRGNVRLTMGERTLTIAEWSRETGIKQATIQARIYRGYSDEDALTKPLRITKPPRRKP